jgi:hypothetical protein
LNFSSVAPRIFEYFCERNTHTHTTTAHCIPPLEKIWIKKISLPKDKDDDNNDDDSDIDKKNCS